MRINTNMAAMNAWKSMETNQTNLQSSLERLSSGYRINKAADDAAGLAVSEKLKAQTRGTAMATRNTQDAVSLVQTAEGGASKIQDMLQRMRELAVQAGSDTLQDTDRTQLQEEFSSLQSEIDRTAGSVQFNGQKLLNGDVALAQKAVTGHVTAITITAGTAKAGVMAGSTLTITRDAGGGNFKVMNGTVDVTSSFTDGGATVTGTGNYVGLSIAYGDNSVARSGTATISGLSFQVGANSGETVGAAISDLRSSALGVDSAAHNISTKGAAQTSINALDTAITNVSKQRASLGATQNRLENIISTLQTQNENITAAESRIREVDMAAEMASFTKYQVLSQASTAMLAQANQLPQGILSLLR